MEYFTGNISRFKDWLICQGQEKLEYRGFLRYVSSILCLHFFITYQAGKLGAKIQTELTVHFFGLLNKISGDLRFE